jgi:hypothetical protein
MFSRWLVTNITSARGTLRGTTRGLWTVRAPDIGNITHAATNNFYVFQYASTIVTYMIVLEQFDQSGHSSKCSTNETVQVS